jgi:hypothetical protein
LKRWKSGWELTPIGSRNKSDDHRPRPDENVSNGCVMSGFCTSVVLVDAEPFISSDEFWGGKENQVKLSSWGENQSRIALTQTHLQHGNSDCDQQVDDHLATLLPKKVECLVTLRNVQSYLTTHLTLSGSRSGSDSDTVEVANDAENAGGPRDGNGDLDANSCINWSKI